MPDNQQLEIEQSDNSTQRSESQAKSVAKSTATMAAATLTSRITGFIRTWALAYALGNTVITSAYQIANTLPTMLYELIAGGVISAAFLPVYMSVLKKHGKEEGDIYASNILSIALVFLGGLAVIATVFAPQFIATQTFKTGGESAELATWFFRFYTIQLLFYGVGGVMTTLLNANRKYFWPMAAPIFNNIVVIITFFGFVPLSNWNPEFAKVWLAVGTTLGVFVQSFIQLPSFMKLGIKFKFHIEFKSAAIRETASLALPALVFTFVQMIFFSIRNAYALEIAPNGPSTLSYAQMWYLLPYGVIIVALATAMFTEMSEKYALGDMNGFKIDVCSGLRTTVFLIIPLAALMLVCAVPLITLFEAGAFTADDVKPVATVLVWWCISLPFYACYMYLYRVFSSIHDLKTITMVDVCLRVLQTGVLIVLSTGIGSWSGWGLVGIALTDFVAYGIGTAAALYMLYKRIGSFSFSSVINTAVRTFIASVIGATIVYLLLQLLGGVCSGFFDALWKLVVCGCLGLIIIYGLCSIFKVPEMSVLSGLLSRVTGKFGKKKTPEIEG